MPDDNKFRSPFSFIRKLSFSWDVAAKVSILLGLSIALAAMFPLGLPIELEYEVGGIWAQKDLIAPFSFPIYRDEREYERDVEVARSRGYLVFERNSRIEAKQMDKVQGFSDLLNEILALRETAKEGSGEPDDSLRLAQLVSQLETSFAGDDWVLLDRLYANGRLTSLFERLTQIARKCWEVGIIDRPKSSFQGREIAIRRGRDEEIVRVERLYDPSDMREILEADLRTAHRNDDDVIGIGYRIGVRFIEPNILYSQSETEAAIAAEVGTVPRTLGFVQQNERIVGKHERITDEIRLKLESFRRAKADRGGEENFPAQFIGIVLHVLIIVMLYAIYIAFFRKRIFANNGRLVLIALLILVQGALAFCTRELDVELPVEYLIMVPVTSMLLTIMFDSRVAFYGTVITAFIVAGIRGNDYSVALASLVAGALSVYTVRDIRNRTQIFRSMGFIFLGYAVTILALALERFESVAVVLTQLSLAFVNALISPVLTYGLLIFFERAFSVTTDLTLIELSHFNHPLLRQLAEKAPGTYHHSMTIASLAEPAAVAIGANGILARVGAYFHDIGKMLKPTYFVENQRGSRSRHDKLAPRMSSLIIQAHVKDGVALAREHRLPAEVVDFIPMHHGTTRVEYFYNKALKGAEDSDGGSRIEEIKEQDYRYPGPKPQTKETGILMLADTIEATVRAMDDHSPQKIEAAIDDMIKKRFAEGELDECPLTLKDLTKIKEAFLRVLLGVYHARVKYPKEQESQRSEIVKTPSDSQEVGG